MFAYLHQVRFQMRMVALVQTQVLIAIPVPNMENRLIFSTIKLGRFLMVHSGIGLLVWEAIVTLASHLLKIWWEDWSMSAPCHMCLPHFLDIWLRYIQVLLLVNKKVFYMLGQEKVVYIFEAKLIPVQPVSTLWGNRAAFTTVSWAVEQRFGVSTASVCGFLCGGFSYEVVLKQTGVNLYYSAM